MKAVLFVNSVALRYCISRLVDAGLLRPHVSHRFQLERLADGHRQVETGTLLERS